MTPTMLSSSSVTGQDTVMTSLPVNWDWYTSMMCMSPVCMGILNHSRCEKSKPMGRASYFSR